MTRRKLSYHKSNFGQPDLHCIENEDMKNGSNQFGHVNNNYEKAYNARSSIIPRKMYSSVSAFSCRNERNTEMAIQGNKLRYIHTFTLSAVHN